MIDSVVAALKTARSKKVLCLSTIGADAKEDNLLSQRTMLENALNELDLPVTFLRPAWFMENALWDVGIGPRHWHSLQLPAAGGQKVPDDRNEGHRHPFGRADPAGLDRQARCRTRGRPACIPERFGRVPSKSRSTGRSRSRLSTAKLGRTCSARAGMKNSDAAYSHARRLQ